MEQDRRIYTANAHQVAREIPPKTFPFRTNIENMETAALKTETDDVVMKDAPEAKVGVLYKM